MRTRIAAIGAGTLLSGIALYIITILAVPTPKTNYDVIVQQPVIQQLQQIGVLALFIAGVGLALLILGATLSEARPAAPAYGFAPAPPVAACPVCHQPLAWIPQHNRWYCSRCGQYR